MTTARDLLVRGLLAGLLAGIATFVVAYAVGEPPLSAAIAYEDAHASTDGGHDHAAGTPAHDHDAGESSGSDEVVVPRSLQSTWGLLTSTVPAGVTLGALVGVVSALGLGRLGRLGPRGVPLLVAGLGLIATSVVPSLVYPPNPPGASDGDTIGSRTALYFVMVAISLVSGVCAVLAARRLVPRLGAWYATLAGAIGYGVVVLVAALLVPTYDEVPADFPATVLADFRTSSFIIQLALWGFIGLFLAELTHRLAVRGRRGEPTVALVDA